MSRWTWNYRVIQHKTDAGCAYVIHEVHYDADGQPVGVTVDPTWPAGDTLEDLRQDLAAYAAALDKPVLEYDELVEQKEDE